MNSYSFKFIVVMSALLLSACASTDKQSSAETNQAEAEVSNSKVSVVGHDKNLISTNKNSASVMVTGHDSLAQAIRQQDDEAISNATTEILTRNPKDVRALNALSMVYYRRGRIEASEYLINKALALETTKSELYSNLGLIKMAQGEKREAIKAFRKGLAVNNQDAIIGANLGSIYLKEKDYSKAELALEIPYRKNSKDVKISTNYAIALTGVGKVNKAEEIYEKLLAENPGVSDIMLNYSILLIDHKQKFREGLDIINRLKFVGAPLESRNLIKELESKAKAGLK